MHTVSYTAVQPHDAETRTDQGYLVSGLCEFLFLRDLRTVEAGRFAGAIVLGIIEKRTHFVYNSEKEAGRVIGGENDEENDRILRVGL